MVTPAQKREAVAHLAAAHRMSERRACRVAGVDRPLVRYRPRKSDDGALRDAGLAIAGCMSCYGVRAGP